MSGIREVCLVGKNLTTIPSSILKDRAETCTHLDLSENQILDHNGIENIDGCPPCLTVDTLYINNNEISDIRAFMDSLVTIFPNLTYLSMLRNPCTPNLYFSEGEAEAYQRYRYYVIYRIKKLQFLDSTPVDSTERAEAERIGHQMAPVKPTENVSQTSNTDGTDGYSLKDIITKKETKTSTFLVRSKPRYDGSNSEGNRFITNDSL